MRLRYALWIVLFALPFLSLGANAQTVSVVNPNWFFSPYNWNIPGMFYANDSFGTAAVPATVEIVTTQPGAYFSVRFTNSSQAILNLDMMDLPIGNNTTSLVVQWRIDDTLYPVHTLTLADAQLTLATGLDNGPHTLQFWLVASDYHQDRWAKIMTLLNGYLAPAQSLRITGLTLSSGATVLAPNLRPKRILFYGDSIAEGAAVTPADDAGQTYAITCAQLLDAEYGVVANPGQGWSCNLAPTSAVPVFGDAFALHYDQTPRFPLPPGTQDPDYVILNIGTNDAITGALPSTVTRYALAWLHQMRSILPTSRIFIVVPFGGFYPQALQDACAQYQAAAPNDKKVGVLDLGPTARTGLMAQVLGGTAQSYDGIHPNIATHRALGYQLAAALQTALGRNDFNADGKSDLILQNTASNQIADWFQNGATVQNGAFVASVPDGDYQVVGSADFNGDGKPDFVFQNRKTNQVALWYMNGTAVLGGGLIAQAPASGYKIVSIGDFNGDGKPDFVFQNQISNQIAFWFMDGDKLLGGSVLDLIPGGGYRLVGTGDFNRDGQNDLLFQDPVTGTLVLWFLKGVRYAEGAVVSAVPPSGYRVEAVSDFDGDGRPDVALRDTAGSIVLWHLDGVKVYSTEAVSARLDTSFRIAGPR
jgi:lysophospholipase L1-like esterase